MMVRSISRNELFSNRHLDSNQWFVTPCVPIVPTEVIKIVQSKLDSSAIIIPPRWTILESTVHDWKVIINIFCRKFPSVVVTKCIICLIKRNNVKNQLYFGSFLQFSVKIERVIIWTYSFVTVERIFICMKENFVEIL